RHIVRPVGANDPDGGFAAIVGRYVHTGERPGLERQRPHHRQAFFRSGRPAEIVSRLVSQFVLTDHPPLSVGTDRSRVLTVIHITSIPEHGDVEASELSLRAAEGDARPMKLLLSCTGLLMLSASVSFAAGGLGLT